MKQKIKQSSVWAERDNKVKKTLKEFRRRMSGGVRYTVKIEDWACDYDFRLNDRYNPLRPDFMTRDLYIEHQFLTLHGEYLEPPDLKGRKIKAMLASAPYLNKKERDRNISPYDEDLPESVGSVRKEEVYDWCFLSIPQEATHAVLLTAVANKIKILTFYGEKLRYGHGLIFNYSLMEKTDDEDPD